MPEVLFSVDQSKSFYDLAVPPHNRWHPDVPPVATVRPGTEFPSNAGSGSTGRCTMTTPPTTSATSTSRWSIP